MQYITAFKTSRAHNNLKIMIALNIEVIVCFGKKKYLKNKGKEILKFGHQKLYDFSLVTEIPKFSITFNIRPQYDIMKTLINWALNF